jgi:predicted transcriptional regulator
MARTQETGQVLPNRKDCGGPPMIAGTVENEEAILNAVEEDGTRSIGEIARPLGISSSTVYSFEKKVDTITFVYTIYSQKITLLEGSSARG